MKVTIYIAKKDFDAFFRWVRRLEIGILSSPPVAFSHIEDDIKDPLRVSLDTDIYYLITDAQDDLEIIKKAVGDIEIQQRHKKQIM